MLEYWFLMQSPLIGLKCLHISTMWECKALRDQKQLPWLARSSEVSQIEAKPRIETLKFFFVGEVQVKIQRTPRRFIMRLDVTNERTSLSNQFY